METHFLIFYYKKTNGGKSLEMYLFVHTFPDRMRRLLHVWTRVFAAPLYVN